MNTENVKGRRLDRDRRTHAPILPTRNDRCRRERMDTFGAWFLEHCPSAATSPGSRVERASETRIGTAEHSRMKKTGQKRSGTIGSAWMIR